MATALAASASLCLAAPARGSFLLRSGPSRRRSSIAPASSFLLQHAWTSESGRNLSCWPPKRPSSPSHLSSFKPPSAASGDGGGPRNGGGEGGGSGGGGAGAGGGEGGDEPNKKKKMLSMSQKLTLAYALLVIAGGVMGFVKGRSVKSLVAGLGAGTVLLYVFTRLPIDPTGACSIGLGVSAILLLIMGTRFRKSGKVMPAGVVSIISFIMTGGYIHGMMKTH